MTAIIYDTPLAGGSAGVRRAFSCPLLPCILYIQTPLHMYLGDLVQMDSLVCLSASYSWHMHLSLFFGSNVGDHTHTCSSDWLTTFLRLLDACESMRRTAILVMRLCLGSILNVLSFFTAGDNQIVRTLRDTSRAGRSCCRYK